MKCDPTLNPSILYWWIETYFPPLNCPSQMQKSLLTLSIDDRRVSFQFAIDDQTWFSHIWSECRQTQEKTRSIWPPIVPAVDKMSKNVILRFLPDKRNQLRACTNSDFDESRFTIHFQIFWKKESILSRFFFCKGQKRIVDSFGKK